MTFLVMKEDSKYRVEWQENSAKVGWVVEKKIPPSVSLRTIQYELRGMKSSPIRTALHVTPRDFNRFLQKSRRDMLL
jgi:hypothetical protein